MVDRLLPKVVLMDISMRGMSGLEALSHITKRWPEVRVIIISMHSEEEYVLQALRSGVHGYILKSSTSDELDMAVRAVASGDLYLSPAIARHVVTDYVRLSGPSSNGLDLLTSRQREILQLLAEGNTMVRIGEILDVSVKTMETHKAELMKRLGIYDMPGLVRFAVRVHLISVDK